MPSHADRAARSRSSTRASRKRAPSNAPGTTAPPDDAPEKTAPPDDASGKKAHSDGEPDKTALDERVSENGSSNDDEPGLADIAEELYSVPLDAFTPARDERAAEIRTQGDRALAAEVKRLRKPSASAWAVNQLVRHRLDEVQTLLDLGASMREAQDELDRDTLRSLTEQRRTVVRALARRAADLAADLGHRINEQAVTDVEQTLQAAMTDPDAATAVRTGCLLRALATTGFDPVDLAGAVAFDGAPATPGRVPASAPRATTRADAAARELTEAREKADETGRWARDAASALDAVERRLEQQGAKRRDLEARETQLLEKLDRVRDELGGVDADTAELDAERDDAAREERRARRSADRARQRVEYLS